VFQSEDPTVNKKPSRISFCSRTKPVARIARVFRLKMGKRDYDVLLGLMQTGRLSVLKASPEADITSMATVLATANYLKKIPAEVLDRSPTEARHTI
jgi:hypothetical protein